MSLLFQDAEITALHSREFALHFLKIRLERQSPDQPRTFTGPGGVRQTPDGHLELTLYAAGQFGPEAGALHWPVGRVLPESAHYTMTATDTRGREWTSDRLLPDAAWCAGGSVVTARLRELTVTEDHRQAASYPPHILDQLRSTTRLELFLFEDIKFPENQNTLTLSEGGGRWRETSTLNIAEFNASGSRFTITREEGMVVIRAWPELARLSPQFRHQVVDALQFVLARPIQPALIMEFRAGVEQITIRGGPADRWRSMLPPPVPFNLRSSAEHTWRLFDCYLSYVCGSSGDAAQRMSAQWRGVLRASAGSVETAALVLSVAVESIVNLTWGGGDAKTRTDRATKFWSRRVRTFLRKAGCPPDVERRFYKLLQRLFQPRAADRLYALAARGEVERSCVDVWHDLRRRAAHGADVAQAPEELLYACDTVAALLYQLVFRAIGYVGLYTNFGRSGWGVDHYPAHASTTPIRLDAQEAAG